VSAGYRRWAGRALLVLVSTMVSVLMARLAAEHLFFDKFYYRKSLAHGYQPADRSPVPLGEFGRRARDLLRLRAAGKCSAGACPPREQLGGGQAPTLHSIKRNGSSASRPDSARGKFTIIVLGDSFCWGQGVREEQRWVHLLERRLNKKRPTRIISLCAPGDGLVHHLTRYRAVRRFWSADMHIFALVSDDLLYPSAQPADRAAREAIAACKHLPQTLLTGESTTSMLRTAYAKGSANRCVMERIVALLPRGRALYVDYGWPWNTYAPVEDVLMKHLRKQGREVLNLSRCPPGCEGKDPGHPDCEDLSAGYYVSERELHPSARLNVRFADVLYRYITSRAEYGVGS